MRRTILVFGFALLALNCAGLLLFFNTPSTHAKVWGFTNTDLWGTFAAQMSGTMLVPTGHPLAAFNGPWASTGRVYADGGGNFKGSYTQNMDGLLFDYSFKGTYVVNEDGTVKLTHTATLFGQTSTIFGFGVICEEGKQFRYTMAGPTMPDPRMPNMPNAGAVITGLWIRQ